MHLPALPGLLRRSPSRGDVEVALRAEVPRHATPAGTLPTAWTVWMSAHDAERADAAWSPALCSCVLDEADQRGLLVGGLVTVSLAASGGLRRGRFRVTAGSGVAVAPPLAGPDPLPGRPRLVLPAGGTARWGSAAAAGVEPEVLLHAGQHLVVGRGHDADLRLDDLTVSPRHAELEVSADGEHVLLRDLASTNGTSVDGVPTLACELVDGNRLELGEAVLVFHRGAVTEDGGRQGGETTDIVG